MKSPPRARLMRNSILIALVMQAACASSGPPVPEGPDLMETAEWSFVDAGTVDEVGETLPAHVTVRGSRYEYYGIGRTRALTIMGKARVEVGIKVKDLSEDEVTKIRRVVQEEGQVEGDLRKNVAMDIKRLMDIGSYRGLRHRRSLPVRGQRTHTNARTKKGPRRAIAGKKKAAGKKG